MYIYRKIHISNLKLKVNVWYETKKTMKEALENMQSFTVKFDMNGHGDAVHDKYVVSGQMIHSKPETPTAAGYVFRGWYKDAACTQVWNWDTQVRTLKKIEEKTYYSGWSKARKVRTK